MDEEISKYKSEIKKLKSQLQEMDAVADKTKEYLFVLENQINEKDKYIKTLKDKCDDLEKRNNFNNQNLKNEVYSLKNKNKKLSDEIRVMKSTVSWKVTKPLRKVKKLL